MRRPRVHRSAHFVLHTDLAEQEAATRLAAMETALRHASQYWRQAPRGRVDCYLVDDLRNWSDDALPHPLARVWVGGIGGATIGREIGDSRAPRGKATVYSAARRGVMEHELVHAYCVQAFNEMGPDWYKEGMAEVLSFRAARHAGVACSPDRIQFLRGHAPKSVVQITAEQRFTRKMSDLLGAKLNDRVDPRRHVPLSDWTQRDVEQLDATLETYAWSWALCHLMVHNPNYANRFRALGISYLCKRDDSFARAFAPVGDKLDFELAFFAAHVDVGYRVDLCYWDWTRKFQSLDDYAAIKTRVAAARGFQPSGLKVTRGVRYEFAALGAWQTSAEHDATDADGADQGQGRLVGVVMADLRLSNPVPLGKQGTFVAPASGDLYLRCQDTWHQLADNVGTVEVEFSRAR